jgi:hypothetical protein
VCPHHRQYQPRVFGELMYLLEYRDALVYFPSCQSTQLVAWSGVVSSYYNQNDKAAQTATHHFVALYGIILGLGRFELPTSRSRTERATPALQPEKTAPSGASRERRGLNPRPPA